MCYSVPAVTSMVTTALWFKNRTKELWQLNLLLYGAGIFGIVDHMWNNELFLISPDISKDLLLGVIITVSILALWGIMMFFNKRSTLKSKVMSLNAAKSLLAVILVFSGLCSPAYAEETLTGKIASVIVADGVKAVKSEISVQNEKGELVKFDVETKTIILNDKSLATTVSRLRVGQEVRVRYNASDKGVKMARVINMIAPGKKVK